MLKRHNTNPFGEWNQIPEIRDNASLNEHQEFNEKWEEFYTEDISENEVREYLEKLNDITLNEAGYAERGWFGVSPFAWTEGFKIGSIFKPLKWIAIPLLGGVVLLLAGIWKLLKEGKKQIAIARVRAWIQKLVVIADSGLKKTRNTKDSLFLIRQRYRRDILQNAVKVATCLGIDVEEKDTKPESVETSMNEGILGDFGRRLSGKAGYSIKVEKVGYDETSQIVKIKFDIEDTKVNVSLDYAGDSGNRIYPDSPMSVDDPAFQQASEEIQKQFNKSNAKLYNSIKSKVHNHEDIGIHEGDILENGEFKPAETTEAQQDVEDHEDSTDVLEDGSDNGSVSTEEKKNITHNTPQELPDDTQLPDDSRVDWSLMNSIRASQWFGLKHKTTNFWKEAKSVAKVDLTQAGGSQIRYCGLLVTHVSQSLTLIANSDVAQTYTSTMNKYIEALTNLRTGDNLAKSSGAPANKGRFGSISDSKYSMFEEDFKVFENGYSFNPEEVLRYNIMNWFGQAPFRNYLKQVAQFDDYRKVVNKISSISGDELNRIHSTMEQLYQDCLARDEYFKEQGIDWNSRFTAQATDVPNTLSTEKIDQYLIAALSKILANTNYNNWQVYNDSYSQMIKFINELTKTVHTVIDSVAKKVEDRFSGGNNTFEKAVLNFISSSPDAKQNRSLKNLWDNMGVSKLQQRTIVHCNEVLMSPEMQYYLDMFMITVPSYIKQALCEGTQQPPQKEDETTKTETPVETPPA